MLKVPIEELGESKVAIDIGCGVRKIKNTIGIDRILGSSADIVADLRHLPLRRDSVDLIIARSVLEHVEDIGSILDEIFRVLKRQGKFRAYVPHAFGRDAFDDPTHKSFYTLNTIDYFCGKAMEYYPGKKFKLGYRKLRVKINPPTNNSYMKKKSLELILLPLNIPIILLGFTFPRFMEEFIKLPFFVGELYFELIKE